MTTPLENAGFHASVDRALDTTRRTITLAELFARGGLTH
jgi:hypothetical protein